MNMFCGQPQDLEIVAGNNQPPAMWQFLQSEDPDVIFPLAGSDFYLMVKWPGGSLTRNTINNPSEITIDVTNAIVTWHYDLATSRLLPNGRLATYELERRINGTEQTFIGGRIVVSGGANVD